MVLPERLSLVTKILKLVINVVVVGLYRGGDVGYFLGASYQKNHDAETLTAGIFVGFMIYNVVTIIAIALDKNTSTSIMDTIMNVIGAILWVTTGAVIIQFWHRFLPENHFSERNPKQAGLSMGALAVINAFVYLGESLIVYTNYRESDNI